MALHSSTFAWKILWTEEPGRLQSMGSLRVTYNWATEQQQNFLRVLEDKTKMQRRLGTVLARNVMVN